MKAALLKTEISPSGHAYPGERVLVVEDDKSNALVASTILRLLGYAFDTVESGEAAVKSACTGKYSIILMDMVLHGISGIQAAKQIRAYERKNNIQFPIHIIALTAKSHIESHHACLNAGINDFLRKPFHLEEMNDKLQLR